MECIVEGCLKEAKARSYCNTHYGQWRRGVRELGSTEPSTDLRRKWSEGRTVPPPEPGLVTHSKSGVILEHGGAGTAYSRHGCRCRECKRVNRERTNKRRWEREAQTAREGVPEGVEHGKSTTYVNWGCRCESCSKAHSEYCREYWSENLSKEAREAARREAYVEGFQAGLDKGAMRAALTAAFKEMGKSNG